MLLARLFARRDSGSSSRSLGNAPRAALRHQRSSRPPDVESLEERTLLSGWAFGVGSDGFGRLITLDASGNSYVAGEFAGTVDFDPGPGTVNLTARGPAGTHDIFVAKYSPTGSFAWAARAGSDNGSGGDNPWAIALDASSNVYVTGQLGGSSDVGNFAPNGGGYIAKLDGSSGNFLWAINAGNSIHGVAVDSSGNIYTTGHFAGTYDFDPGPGVQNLTSQTASGDAFFWKLDSNANFVWVRQAGSNSGQTSGRALAVDASANIYVQGKFVGTASFGGTSLTSEPVNSNDFFVTKLDSAGNFSWAQREGTPLNENFGCGNDRGIAVDGAGNVYTTARFAGSAVFGSTTLTSALAPDGTYSGDVFVAKQDVSGNFLWAKAAGGSGLDCGEGAAVDGTGNVYVAMIGGGGFVDFDPGPGAAIISGSGAFVWKLDGAGNFAWVRRTLSSGDVRGIGLDSSANVFTTGANSGGDFDTGSTTVTVNGAIYVLKTTQDVPTIPQLSRLTDSPDPVSNKGSGVVTLTAYDIRIVAGGSNVASVSFYRDTNGNGTLQVGTDLLLGTDTDGSNGWSRAQSIPKNFPTGTYTYFAQAKDSANVVGNVVSTTNTVSRQGGIAAMVTSRDRYAGIDHVLASQYSDERRHNHASDSDLLRDLLSALGRVRRHR